MRRFFVLIAVTVAFILAGVGVVLTGDSTTSSAKVGSQHFLCVAAWNYGICIGPPTKQG